MAYGVGLISKFMERPNTSHYAAAKRILKYIKGILDYDQLFPHDLKTKNEVMLGYTDFDWYGDQDDRRSTA